MEPPHTNDDPMRARSNHPLILKLKQIRKRHRKKLVDVEACLGIPFGTLKQIEEGRRPLPPLISPTGEAFSTWYQSWIICVGASPEEQQDLEEKLSMLVIGQLRRNL
jgi:transcriptional regulator with XRE-family HTH domain